MNMFSFLLTMGITLAGVHSSPAPVKISSEMTSASGPLNAARALSSGDQYPPQPPGAGPGKRGLLYNSKSKVAWSNFYYESPFVTYASNGDVIRGGEINAWFSYVPTIAVDAALENSNWNDIVPILIEGGTKAMFASNEPDNPSQANLSPSQCATVFKKYMQPYYGTVQLGTPAVTNNNGAHTGLSYLDTFLTVCTDCAYNFVNVHFFVNRAEMDVATYVAALKTYVDITVPALQAKHKPVTGLPIAIGAFWLTDASETEAGTLMAELLPWLDSHANVLFYQAAGGLFEGQFINGAGTGLTDAGKGYGLGGG